jgi:predicted DsbA family dithiol-disulfide isomerase
VVSALFRAYFRDGRDIGRADTLVEIASGAGLDQTVIAQLLQGPTDADDLLARDADARRKGVRAVPTFVIAGQHVIEGAQPVELWQRIIDELMTKAG